MSKFIFLAALIMFNPVSQSHSQSKPKPIADRLFQFSDLRGGNAVFLVTDEGVIVVDAGTYPSEGKRMVEQVASVTDQTIRYVILTHYHMDHTAGLVSFPKSAGIIGHQTITEHLKRNEIRIKNSVEKDLPAQIDELKKNIAAYKKSRDTSLAKAEQKLKGLEDYLGEMKSARVIYPTITFNESMTLYSGKDTIRILYPGPAHTRCNIIVHFVNHKAVHTGDMLFNGKFPYIMWPDGPNTKNWVKQLDNIMEWDIGIVIPGHGAITDKKGIQKKTDYLKALRQSVADAMGKGLTLEQMRKEITLPDFGHLEWLNLLPQNIESVYNEMNGQ